MRALIDIPEAELKQLAELGERSRRSRASMVREAIAEYLDRHAPAAEAAFGLWGERKIDGLAYQRKVRSEW
jgi:predicted transcriptional regulator